MAEQVTSTNLKDKEAEFARLSKECRHLGERLQKGEITSAEERETFEKMFADREELRNQINTLRNVESLNQHPLKQQGDPVPDGVIIEDLDQSDAEVRQMGDQAFEAFDNPQQRPRNPRAPQQRKLNEFEQRMAYASYLSGNMGGDELRAKWGLDAGAGGFPTDYSASKSELHLRYEDYGPADANPQPLPDLDYQRGIYLPRNFGWWRKQMEKRQQAAQPQGPTGTAGGATVPDWPIQPIEEALKAYGGMRVMSEIVSTSHGGDMPWPTVNDTAQKGEILAENTQVNQQDITYGQVVYKAYKYSSKLVRASVEFLQDSATNQMALIPKLLGIRIGRITNEHFTTGTGTSQPTGIVTAAAAGPTAAATTTITWPELMALKSTVDPDYAMAPGAGWMFNWVTLMTQLRTLQDDRKRPLWTESLVAGAPDLFDGQPYVVNQDMASAAAGTIPVIYGDLTKYKIRDVLGITQLVLRERYADYHQLGFLAFSRHDGQLQDAGTNPVKKLTMAAS